MNRRTQIIALFVVLFFAQVALLIYWHVGSAVPLRPADVAISALTLLVTGVVYYFSARYYLKAIKQAAAIHAMRASEDLERSLELYRTMADREEQLVRRICEAIDAELVQAQEELAQGETTEVSVHLQRSLDMASEAIAPRCQNAVIAAVLDAEDRQFSSEGIELTTKANIPAEIGIPDIEIAAVLFNLADEALANCKALIEQDPSAKPSASIRMLTDTGQLVIETESPGHTGSKKTRRNAAKSASSKTKPNWSARVIEDFVQGNGGIVEFAEGNGIARTSVMIPLQGTREG